MSTPVELSKELRDKFEHAPTIRIRGKTANEDPTVYFGGVIKVVGEGGYPGYLIYVPFGRGEVVVVAGYSGRLLDVVEGEDRYVVLLIPFAGPEPLTPGTIQEIKEALVS